MKHLWLILLVAPIFSQEISNDNTYSIYTTADTLANYSINSIEGDVIIANKGFRNIKISINEIERIELPERPTLTSKVIGGAIGVYSGYIGGYSAGGLIVLITGESPLEPRFDAPLVVAGLTGAYLFGRKGSIKGMKFGGILEAEIVADFSDWTLDEKKDFIRTSIIK
jgi:hypothetical protein